MSAVPSAIRAAIEPQVNLIPPEVAGRKAQGRRTGLIGLAFLALLAAIVGATFVAGTVRDSAQAKLAATNAERDRINAEIATYQYVIDAQAAVANAKSARLYAGAADLQWAPLFDKLRDALPAGTNIATVTWAPTTIDSAADTNVANVFAVPDVGSIALSGSSIDAIDIPALEDALDAEPGLARARVLTVVPVQPSDGPLTWTFTATVRITYDALSGHFTDPWLTARGLTRSDAFLYQMVATATMEYNGATADATAGVAGAAARASDAAKRRDELQGWLDQVDKLGKLYAADLEAVTKAEADVAATTGGTKADGKAAKTALTAAQDSLSAHHDALNAFTAVIQTYAEAVRARDHQQAMIDWAQASETAAADALTSARAALDAAKGGTLAQVAAAQQVAVAQQAKDIADAALTTESAKLPDLQTALDDAEKALVAAAADAAKAATATTDGSSS